jgi:hypothetical protein
MKLPEISNLLARITLQVLTPTASKILNLKLNMPRKKLDQVHNFSIQLLINSSMTFLQLNTQLSLALIEKAVDLRITQAKILQSLKLFKIIKVD